MQIQAPEHAIDGNEGNKFRSQPGETREPECSSTMSWTSASLIYSFKGPLDIAVLQLDDLAHSSSLRDVSLRPAGVNAAGQGEGVAVMGYPLFSPRLGLGSCVTAGMIAKVSTVCYGSQQALWKLCITFLYVQPCKLNVKDLTRSDDQGSAECRF